MVQSSETLKESWASTRIMRNLSSSLAAFKRVASSGVASVRA